MEEEKGDTIHDPELPGDRIEKPIRLGIRFPDQEPEEWGYNFWDEITVIYHSFNEDFVFPNPEGAQA